MKIVESNWQTPDGTRLYTREWTPDGDSRAWVVLIHGLGEHCARYDHVAEKFSANDIHTLGFDYRGHGRSDGKRGHIPAFDLILQDIAHFLSEATRQAADKPVFLYGHSMGGEVVLLYVIQRRPAIRGVICTGPSLETGVPVHRFSPRGRRSTSGAGISWMRPGHTKLSATGRGRVRADPGDEMVSARLGLDILNR
jgi:alpha-beta hydrolase superfamily lysophospholipase